MKNDLYERGEEIIRLKRKHSKSQRDVDLEDQLADQRKTIHRMRDKLRKIDELENNDHNLRKRCSRHQQRRHSEKINHGRNQQKPCANSHDGHH